jgi:hypothetical protein
MSSSFAPEECAPCSGILCQSVYRDDQLVASEKNVEDAHLEGNRQFREIW